MGFNQTSGKTATVQEDSKKLDIRAYVNENFSRYNLDEWIVSNLKLNEGDKVLDIGCGSGKQIPYYLSKIGTSGVLYVIDSSSDSIEKVKQKHGNDKRVHIFCAKMEEINKIIPLTNFFDKIVSTFAIYYTSTPENTFKTLHNMLNKKGIVFVSGPAKITNQEFIDFQKNIGLKTTEDVTKWSVFLENTAQKLMKTNFGNVERIDLINPVSFPNAELLIDYWKATPLYSKQYEKAFIDAAEEHFRKNRVFFNSKNIIGLKSIKVN